MLLSRWKFRSINSLLLSALACTTLLWLPCTHAAAPAVSGAESYREPDAEVVRLLTATPPPTALVNAPSRQVALLYRESVISMQRLMQPRLGLAGYRLIPATRTEDVYPLTTRVEIHPGGRRSSTPIIEWQPADGALLDFVKFSPDGRLLSALVITADAADLALFDVATGKARRLNVNVNPAWGDPCTWTGDDTLMCRVVPANQGRPPGPFPAPMLVSHGGNPEPARTYAYLLKNAHDDALFEYYFAAELAHVGIDGSIRRIPGLTGLIERFDPSPDAAYAVISRIERPYSRLLPARRFPSVVEVWDTTHGHMLYESRDTEGDEDLPTRAAWKPGTPTTLGFIRTKRDSEGNRVSQWMEIDPPFSGTQRTVARTEAKIRQFGWTSEGTPWYTTPDADGNGIQVHVPGSGSEPVWTGSTSNAYDDPGSPLGINGSRGPVLESNGRVFLAGDGESAAGPRPMLDAFDLRTGKTQRLFESAPGEFERVLGIIDPAGPVFVTSRETESVAPRLYLHDGGKRTAMTPERDPYPALADTTRRVLNFRRKDGLALSGTLYLPADYQEGDRLPTLVWIYPHEFTDREQAEQLDLRAFRFHRVIGPSPLAAVVAGYAVLMNPTVPILYEGSTVNDNYLPQLVSSLDAAVEHLVALGVTDPARIAVAGRSYGAFSAANLLIHSDRFATAICLSGAYNRTLTPFGFQHEGRSFWEASDMYANVSPFFHADEVDRPILLIHGGDDENSGTPPMQARRFLHALIGEGATVRYVELPHEGHHYRARENVLLAAAEMLDWLDQTIGQSSTAGADRSDRAAGG